MCEHCECSKNFPKFKDEVANLKKLAKLSHAGHDHKSGKHDHTHPHDHEHPHPHPHPHGHDHDHSHSHAGHDHPHEHHGHTHELKTVPLDQKILAKNDDFAAKNREWLRERGIVAINMISSPGAGKTFLLEKTLTALRGKVKCAVITGDLQTDNDAKRLAGKGAPVKQIQTQDACHLDAERVGKLLPAVCRKGTKLLFIENVGNLVCPAAFDLGESLKVALLAVTEGEDKPVKYPTLFSLAPIAILTKMDLLKHLDAKITKYRESLRKTRPGVCVFELSARNGKGMAPWLEYLQRLAG